MVLYNWQFPDWPLFHFEPRLEEELLFDLIERVGRVSGLVDGLTLEGQMAVHIDLMIAEAMKTSAIEGEFPDQENIRSSIQYNLGLTQDLKGIRDRSAIGLGAMMVDVRRTFQEPLTEEKLFEWHQWLLGEKLHIHAGAWRTGKEPMRVVSGAIGREVVHFEAPPSVKVPEEMDRFIRWFNDSRPHGRSNMKSALIRAAISHGYFESIHPFEDGNGRIGRAIAEKALAQSLGRPVLFSLSRAIEANRQGYYEALQHAQRSLDISGWIRYFMQTILLAQIDAEAMVDFTLKKAKFFDRFRDLLNERQMKVISRMFEEGVKGFEGGMNARKYMSIASTSKATSTRDLQELVSMGPLRLMGTGGGRSTCYEVNF
jgi:Fic family protein